MCTCACMCGYVCTCVCACVMHACICVCNHVQVCVYTCACVRMCLCMNVYKYPHTTNKCISDQCRWSCFSPSSDLQQNGCIHLCAQIFFTWLHEKLSRNFSCCLPLKLFFFLFPKCGKINKMATVWLLKISCLCALASFSTLKLFFFAVQVIFSII